MKTTRSKLWTAVCVSVLTATAMFRASADESATAAVKNDKSYTGTVTSVYPKEHVLNVRGWTTFNKAFNLGATCAYNQLDKSDATISDLRPGEKVTVIYQDAHGVLIANSVAQEPMRLEGMVKAIDTNRRTLTIHQTVLDKEVQLPADCNVVLRGGKSGSLADIQVGNHVTVTYETPGDASVARQIEQTSIEFTGTLTAIDLNDQTLKAKALFTSKKFNVADNCAIVIEDGRTDGKLGDLKPNDRLVFSYDEINGVNVVERIALADNQPNSVASTAPMTGN